MRRLFDRQQSVRGLRGLLSGCRRQLLVSNEYVDVVLQPFATLLRPQLPIVHG